ncbi:cystatin-12-like [Microcebus murinus]|uniref:cystatin-12-like n=1 Tax=Microcebus murinus TaxID=30608 RepID=UPI003F6D2BE0
MWQKVLLLGGLIVLQTQVCSCRFVDIDQNYGYFTICLEYAVFQFNENQEDEYAYKFLQVQKSQHKRDTLIYLMDLELGRTTCKKHDEDIDNCPLQDGAGEKTFKLLNSTCVQETW